MARPSAQARERVCPHCASLATSADRHCPWCGRSYTRGTLPAVAAMLIVTAAVVLGGVWYMLALFGDELDSQLDREVEAVQRDFDRDVRGLQRDIRRDLDRRLPALTPTP
ncbi:MAG TPA: zinc ribbon domain-containing protein [Solirubrobacteraceae bacterium]|nr:zinc ribbon domain-containing protein [Solirubrobacteraceae bacterium]